MSMILDASTALAAILPDENSGFARAAVAAALRDGLVVPALWPYEVQNGLVMAMRRNRIDSDSVDDALAALRDLAAEVEAPQGLGQELRLAQAHGLSAFDAAYLAVARNTGATLATNDARLRRAAEIVGIAVFTEPNEQTPPRKHH
jgi:predicted nucleic acid-binding protein